MIRIYCRDDIDFYKPFEYFYNIDIIENNHA